MAGLRGNKCGVHSKSLSSLPDCFVHPCKSFWRPLCSNSRQAGLHWGSLEGTTESTLTPWPCYTLRLTADRTASPTPCWAYESESKARGCWRAMGCLSGVRGAGRWQHLSGAPHWGRPRLTESEGPWMNGWVYPSSCVHCECVSLHGSGLVSSPCVSITWLLRPLWFHPGAPYEGRRGLEARAACHTCATLLPHPAIVWFVWRKGCCN